MKRERENSKNEEEEEEDLNKYKKMYKWELGVALWDACKDGNSEVVKTLLENDADVNYNDGVEKMSGLHFAAKEGHVDVVELLIQNGADVNAVEKDKETALHYAAREGHVDVAKVLLENDADVNAGDYEELTALHNSAENGHVDVVEVLIQNGADVNAGDERDDRALHWAAGEGLVEVVKVLIQYGADVNACGEETVLHSAAFCGHVDVLKVLLQNGADVNAVDCKERTALDYLVTRHRPNVCCMLQLLCFGAEINESAIKANELPRSIYNTLTSLRKGNGMETTLMSDEERRFMWNLAFFFTIKHGGATAFRSFTTIRSFITYHGIFMGPGYDRGKKSVWRKTNYSKTLVEDSE